MTCSLDYVAVIFEESNQRHGCELSIRFQTSDVLEQMRLQRLNRRDFSRQLYIQVHESFEIRDSTEIPHRRSNQANWQMANTSWAGFVRYCI
jgi:hypothetical protein